MTTTTDISNQALLQVGRRKVISSTVQDSEEAQSINIAFSYVQNWCFGLANWNFARAVSALVLAKQLTPPPPNPWSGASPAPPWLYEYSVPSGFIQARYLTNSAANLQNNAYLGELQRFAVGSDGNSTVILTNQANAVLVYTALVANPGSWPWHFQRLMVAALAWAIAPNFTDDWERVKYLDDLTTRMYLIAKEMNDKEALWVEDTTPEWIRATGIDYPSRRQDNREPRTPLKPEMPNGNRR